ncbi:MAG: peptidylprolyl isomerase, partial [Acidimicrobiales bacterium]
TAAAAGQQFGADVFARFPLWLRRLFQLRQLEQDALGKALGTNAITDAAITKFYNDHLQDFVTNQCVQHILVKTQPEADAVYARLQTGADFAAVAAQSSTDAATAAKGGDLGCGAPGAGANPITTDQQFVQAATTAPIGTVTKPVQVGQGWDVLEVTKRTVQPLNDQVKQVIQQQLQQQQQQASPLSQFFQKATATLRVQINPVYGHWDARQLTVVAPNSPDPVRSGLPTPPAAATPTTVPGG